MTSKIVVKIGVEIDYLWERAITLKEFKIQDVEIVIKIVCYYHVLVGHNLVDGG